MRRAYIVWNEARTEGVIFVDDEEHDPAVWPLSAQDDAEQALTGVSRHPGLGSALAERWLDCYGDQDALSMQCVEYDKLVALSPIDKG